MIFWATSPPPGADEVQAAASGTAGDDGAVPVGSRPPWGRAGRPFHPLRTQRRLGRCGAEASKEVTWTSLHKGVGSE